MLARRPGGLVTSSVWPAHRCREGAGLVGGPSRPHRCPPPLSPAAVVLVDQLRLLGRLAGADHEFLQLGARVGGEGVAGVPQVVEAEVLGQTDLVPCLAPLPAEGRTAQRRTLLSHEHQAIGARLGEPLQVASDVDENEGRQHDLPFTCTGLGSPMARRPVFSSGAARRTHIEPASRSTSRRRSSASSSGRIEAKAPSSTMRRQRSPITSATAKTCATEATGRSSASSRPAPRILQGFLRIMSSPIAVSMTAFRRR